MANEILVVRSKIFNIDVFVEFFVSFDLDDHLDFLERRSVIIFVFSDETEGLDGCHIS